MMIFYHDSKEFRIMECSLKLKKKEYQLKPPWVAQKLLMEFQQKRVDLFVSIMGYLL